ncbi:response regulator [Sphingomonas sp. LB-2]|uniref:response regulator n=1 Tax=Sphingomonas caeni TaxID=2984949 RepID=UPI0022306D34|nr:response regulator [Sphingomonas caeni]MCW3846669.1 response regulator [Sphingomonas caeni]
MTKPANPLKSVPPAEPLPAVQAVERARVLVVDDDERNLLAITNVLEDIAEVVVAGSGEEALRQLLRHDFAVILLDVYMPGLDGYETAALVRAREQTKRVPIVFLSAVNKEIEHLLRGYSMGAVDYVFKPVDPLVLKSKVAVFVDLFQMTREIQRKALQEQQLLDAMLRANAERLDAERQLRLAEQRQAAIIESLPIILFLEPLQQERRLPEYVGGNFEAVTGFTIEDVKANPDLWAERIHDEDRERVLAALARRQETGRLNVEYRWRAANGSYRHLHDQAVVLRDARGEPLEYAGTIIDVTERKELESQLTQVRKMDAIGQLTGGIAHDFNNLLAAILGGLGMIERRVPLEAEEQRVLGMTRHAAEQGAGLVKHLLAFSRRQKLEPGRVDVARLAGSLSELMNHMLGGMVEVSWAWDEALDAPYADAAQLELALMNLIINARDAMPEGGVVTVRASNREVTDPIAGLDAAAGAYVVFEVIDTGCGIAPELLEQVMEPFFTTKAIGKGTGLGLSMVYGFVKQSGGAIRVESEVGKGTAVELWLPSAPEHEAGAIAERQPSEFPPGECPALNILLVDDHEGVRATTMAMLADLGHRVVDVGDGASALELLRASPESFDMVLTDYAMPRVSGADLIRQMRQLRPGLPALIITGYAEPDAAIPPAPDVPILAKPFCDEQLRASLRHACASKTVPSEESV